MKKFLLLAGVGILATASIASAGNQEGQFSLSPIVGGYSYDTKQYRKSDVNLVYGARAGYNFTKRFGVEALFDSVDSSYKGTDINMYRYGGELLYHIFPDNNLVPYLAAGFAGLNFDAAGYDKKARGVFDYGLGAKYFLTDGFALRADLRHLIYRMDNRTNNNLEYTLGAYFPFGGVKPAVKPVAPAPVPAPAPIVAPAPAPKAVEPPPAPAPPPPAAPTAALSLSPSKIMKGQTSTLNWKSQNASACDIQPGIGQVPPQGVRVVTPTGDTSYSLTCSGAGGTATSAAGVTVVTPPPPPPAPVVPKVTAAAERFCSKPAVLNIQFDTDKSVVKPQYAAELKTVSDFLKEFPKAKGEISGHTDNVGGKAYNDKLSQSRAESVKKYIVDKFGISADRISAKGYGFSKPVATNKTKEGKAMNRRIEANFTCE